MQHLPQPTSQKSKERDGNIGVYPVYQYVCVSGVKYERSEVLGQLCALLPLLPDRECCIVLYCIVLYSMFRKFGITQNVLRHFLCCCFLSLAHFHFHMDRLFFFFGKVKKLWNEKKKKLFLPRKKRGKDC